MKVKTVRCQYLISKFVMFNDKLTKKKGNDYLCEEGAVKRVWNK